VKVLSNESALALLPRKRLCALLAYIAKAKSAHYMVGGMSHKRLALHQTKFVLTGPPSYPGNRAGVGQA
jgi:hypothetical protein